MDQSPTTLQVMNWAIKGSRAISSLTPKKKRKKRRFKKKNKMGQDHPYMTASDSKPLLVARKYFVLCLNIISNILHMTGNIERFSPPQLSLCRRNGSPQVGIQIQTINNKFTCTPWKQTWQTHGKLLGHWQCALRQTQHGAYFQPQKSQKLNCNLEKESGKDVNYTSKFNTLTPSISRSAAENILKAPKHLPMKSLIYPIKHSSIDRYSKQVLTPLRSWRSGQHLAWVHWQHPHPHYRHKRPSLCQKLRLAQFHRYCKYNYVFSIVKTMKITVNHLSPILESWIKSWQTGVKKTLTSLQTHWMPEMNMYSSFIMFQLYTYLHDKSKCLAAFHGFL